MDKLFGLFGSKKKNTNRKDIKETKANNNIDHKLNDIDEKECIDNNENNRRTLSTDYKEEENTILSNLISLNNNTTNSHINKSDSNQISDNIENNNSTIKNFDNNNETGLKSNYSNTFSDNVVEINVVDINKQKVGGHYYNKYIDKLHIMSPSNPILLESSQNKIYFDQDSIESFVEDLTTIYKNVVDSVENNQNKINTELEFNKELLKLMNHVYSDSNFLNNLNSTKNESKMMKEIDSLETLVDNLTNNLEVLYTEFSEIERKVFGEDSCNKINDNEENSNMNKENILNIGNEY